MARKHKHARERTEAMPWDEDTAPLASRETWRASYRDYVESRRHAF